MKHTTFSPKGFTLLETLASIAIMSLMIVGPLAVITGSSSYARQTKDSIIASYLAEEAIELIENQYDSLYLLCKKQPEIAYCTPGVGETTGEVSWRLFKTKFSGIDGQPSCYRLKESGVTENEFGCTYDYTQMIGDITLTPPRSTGSTSGCKSITGYTIGSVTRYLCTGSSHATGATASSTKSYSRTVFLEQIPTYETGGMLTQYNDDIKVISEVAYKGVNGVTYTSKLSRFIHAQP